MAKLIATAQEDIAAAERRLRLLQEGAEGQEGAVGEQEEDGAGAKEDAGEGQEALAEGGQQQEQDGGDDGDGEQRATMEGAEGEQEPVDQEQVEEAGSGGGASGSGSGSGVAEPAPAGARWASEAAALHASYPEFELGLIEGLLEDQGGAVADVRAALNVSGGGGGGGMTGWRGR